MVPVTYPNPDIAVIHSIVRYHIDADGAICMATEKVMGWQDAWTIEKIQYDYGYDWYWHGD